MFDHEAAAKLVVAFFVEKQTGLFCVPVYVRYKGIVYERSASVVL